MNHCSCDRVLVTQAFLLAHWRKRAPTASLVCKLRPLPCRCLELRSAVLKFGLLLAAFLEEMYSREMPEDSTAFWACLRRAFPDAMTDRAQYELAIANTGLVYAAGTETTASAVASTLALLATEPPTMQLLEEVRSMRRQVCACQTVSCCISRRLGQIHCRIFVKIVFSHL